MHSGHIKLIAGDHPTYDDRDIMCACNHLTIRRMAGWRLCGKRSANRQFIGINSSGFLPHSHLLKDWFSKCSELMLERLNKNQCRITRLRDQQVVVVTTGRAYVDLNGKPDRFLDVDRFFSHKIRSFLKADATGSVLFSDDDNKDRVVMFGGRTYASDDSMDDVWAAIHTKTGRIEETETTYEKEPPFGSSDPSGQLIVRVDDFSDQESGILIEPLFDEVGIVLKKRKKFVDWQNDIGLTENDVANVIGGSKNDHREIEQVRDVIVQVKI